VAESIRKAEYFALAVANRRGEAAKLLEQLAASGVDLLAFTGFPGAAGRAQLDFVPSDAAAFRSTAERMKWKLRPSKTVFVIQADDRAGALASVLKRLADAKINVTAVDAVSGGSGRFSAMLWVKPKDVEKAVTALGAA
jgi:hypothetical protein